MICNKILQVNNKIILSDTYHMIYVWVRALTYDKRMYVDVL